MKRFVLSSMLLFAMLCSAQENYKIIIMPKKFEFLNEENKYNLNVLCKLFFEKEGFEVYFENDKMPSDIANNRCNALFMSLVENNTLFKTKIKVELKDCQNNIVTFSEEGETREKDLNKAYNEATRFALKSLQGYTNFKNPYANSIEKKKVTIEVDKSNEPIEETVETESSIKEQKGVNLSLRTVVTKNGYNLVDSSKKVYYELLKTSNPTIFIAKKGNIQGVFTLSGQNSKFESYQNDELVVEEVEVKF